MLRTLTVGLARSLFLAAVAVAAIAFLLGYASWRLLRSSVARGPGLPVREAGFALLLALAGLLKALQSQAVKRKIKQ